MRRLLKVGPSEKRAAMRSSCAAAGRAYIGRSGWSTAKKWLGCLVVEHASRETPSHPARVDPDLRRAHVGAYMTRNPNLPIAAVSDPIKVALLTDDPLLRAGVSSLLAQLGSIEVVDRDAAEVALWDAGVDAGRTLN